MDGQRPETLNRRGHDKGGVSNYPNYAQIHGALARVADGCRLSQGGILAGALAGFAAEWTEASQIAVRRGAHDSTLAEVLLEQPVSGVEISPDSSIVSLARMMPGDANALWVEILPEVSARVDLRTVGEGDLLLQRHGAETHGLHDAGRLMDAFSAWLDMALEHAEAPLRGIPLVTPAETPSLLALGRGPAHPFPEDALVHELIYEVAKSIPDRAAIESAGSVMTFADLCATSGRIHETLERAGVQADGLVGLCMRRHNLLVPTILAILQTGCAYVPLDSTMPAVRRDRIFRDLVKGGMEWIVADRGAEACWPDIEMHDKLPSFPEVFLYRLPRPEAQPTRLNTPRLAYVLYTSGSTGEPKGTMVTHRNVVAFIHATEQMLGGVPDETILATTPLTFDISVLEVLWPLATGRRVLLLDSIVDLRADELSYALASPGPKLLQVTPSTSSLVQLPSEPNELRIVVGGEALHTATATRLFQRCIRLYNAYGPTEATVWVTYHEVAGIGDVSDAATVSLGRPLPNCGLVIIDRHGRVAPMGMEGELHIYGAQVAAGYLNVVGSPAFYRSEIADGANAYRTGDRVRWSAEGTLEFIGRVDGQVKVSGNRVELGEVEAALLEHAGVVQAAVVVQAKEQSKSLHGFIRLADPAPSARDHGSERVFVSDWARVFDDEFADTSAADDDPGDEAGFWRSEIDGSAIHPGEMSNWYGALVAVLERLGATRVLDVGCGMGALLTHMGPLAERYVGVEPSRNAVTRLRSLHEGRRDVAFLQGEAHGLADPGMADSIRARFGEGGGPDLPDCIVLNSVVQYFPSLGYLTQVLDAAADLVADSGAIVVADVRSLPLLPAYADWLERAGGNRTSVSTMNELCIDPRFFADWVTKHPQQPRVWVTPRFVERDNELSLFRYDVVIAKSHATSENPPYEIVDYSSLGGTPEALVRHLERAVNGQPVAVTGIPNRSLVTDEAVEADGLAAVELHRLVDRLPGVAVALDPLSMDSGALLVARSGDVAQHDWALLASSSPSPTAYAFEPSRRAFLTALGETLWPFLAERLPRHMIPATVSVIRAFPLTSSGKINRKELASLPSIAARHVPHPRSSEASRSDADVAQDPDVQRVVRMMSDLLGGSLGPTEDFVHAGGTSLDAARLSRLLWEHMEWNLRPGEVLRLRNAHAICEAGRASVQSRPAEKTSAYTPRLSMAQQAMVAMSYMSLEQPGKLNISMRWQLFGNVKENRAVAAVQHLIHRHSILRSTVSREGELSVLSPSEAAAMSRCRQEDDLNRPFDLSRQVPIRWAFHQPTTHDALLHIVLHHVAVDDAAIETINEELLAAYAGGELASEPLDARYRAALDSERKLYLRNAPAARKYWTAQRGKFGSRGRPAFKSVETAGTPGSARFSTPLPGGAHRINDAARRADVTPYSFFLAVVGWSISTELSADEVLAGVPISSRESSGADGLLGCYANLVPISVPLHAGEAGRTVSETAHAMLAALDHGVLPFAEIWRLASLPQNDQGQPAISVLCQLEEMPPPETAGGTMFTLVLDPPRSPMYPLIIRGEIKDSLFTVHADFDPSAVDVGQAEAVVTRIVNTLSDESWCS